MQRFGISFLSSILLTLFFFSCDKPEETPEIKADFSVSSNTVVAGKGLTFSDKSAGNPNEWSWTFEGGTPATSEEQNPVITYNEPGTYKVTLTASNSEKSDQVVKEGFIVVEENCEINDKVACALEVSAETEVKDKITEKNQKKWYSINVSKPGVLITTVSSVPADLAIKIEVLNDKGEVMGGSPNYSEGAGKTITHEILVNTGKYFIRISDHFNKFSNEEYKLLVSVNTDDPNEINNSISEATEITFGENIKGTFRPSKDEDFFVFTTDKAGVIEIVVSNIDPDLNIRAFLYDDKQVAIDQSNYSKEGNLTYEYFLDPGTYYLKLFETSKSSPQIYNLTVSLNTDDPNENNNSFDNATVLALDKTVQGTIRTGGDKDHFKVVLDKAGVIEVLVTNVDPAITMSATLYNEDQKPEANSSYSQGGNLNYQHLLPAGTYYLVLKASGSQSSKQIYNLTVSLNTDDPNEMNDSFETATKISLGESVYGTLKTSGDNDYFIFKTDKAGVLEVMVKNIAPRRSLLAYLYDNNQKYITLGSTLGGNLNFEKAVEAGTYYLLLPAGSSTGDEIYEMVVRVR